MGLVIEITVLVEAQQEIREKVLVVKVR